jgi:hypothetical protein
MGRLREDKSQVSPKPGQNRPRPGSSYCPLTALVVPTFTAPICTP